MSLLNYVGDDGDSRRYDAMLGMADLMALHLSLPELFAGFSKQLHQVIAFEIANFSLHDPARNTMRPHIFEGGEHMAIPSEVSVEDSASGWVWRHQSTLVIPNLHTETRFPEVLDVFRSKGISSYCMLPLTTAQARFGSLGLGSFRIDAYQGADIKLLERVAKLAALVLEKSSIHKALQREKAALKALFEVNTTLASSLDIGKLFPLISSSIGKVIGHEYVTLALHDNATRSLRMYALDGTSEGFDVVVESESSQGSVVYQAYEKRETMIVRRTELEQMKGHALSSREGIQSLCCVPLLTTNGSLGTLNVGSVRENAFDEIDMSVLNQIAGHLAVALDNSRAYREIEELKDKLGKEKLYLQDEICAELNFEEIVGDSPVLRAALSQAKTVAPSSATTLILGETGTGKELVARAIHRMSSRKDRSFIKLNCSAIPTGLLESELFGHEKGAFTGAINQKIGRLELAHNGTLFLDEIGDLPLELQPKLLRVLQDQEFERLGSNRMIRVNVRLIAATNRDLQKRVANNEFRSDLYYRLNVFPIVMPPLRERGGDLIQLVRYFVQKLSRRVDKKIDTIPTETMKALQGWSWPGNVRELENFIERSVILSEGAVLRVPVGELRSDVDSPDTQSTLREVERRHIIRVLKETRGVIAGAHGAALRLGLKRTTLQSRIQKLRITRQEYAL